MQKILFMALAAVFVYLLYLIFSPFLVPVAWACVLTIIFYPIHKRILKRLKRVNLAALISTVLVTAIIVVPGLAVLASFTSQAIDMAQWAQEEWGERKPVAQALQVLPLERMLDWLAEHDIGEEEIRNFVAEKLEAVVGFLAGQAGRLAANVAFFFFQLFFTLFTAFYLFRDGPALLERLRRGLPLDEVYREGLFYIAHNVLYATVYSSFVVALVQGLLGGITFAALGIQSPLFWGVAMGLFSLLPAVGPWLIWLPAALVFLLEGKWGYAITLLVVGVLVISLVDNILRPALISGRAQMNGLLVFISILGGIAAFGVLGLVLGPILVALGVALIEHYTAARLSSPTPAETAD